MDPDEVIFPANGHGGDVYRTKDGKLLIGREQAAAYLATFWNTTLSEAMAKEMYESAASHQVDGFYGFRISQNGTWDPVTDKRISQLDKRVQGPATDFINTVESKLGIQLRVTQGFRTNKEQDALYAQGRTTSGKVVTNARGGASYHNYGLAFDVVVMRNGQPVWEKLSTDIANIGISWI